MQAYLRFSHCGPATDGFICACADPPAGAGRCFVAYMPGEPLYEADIPDTREGKSLLADSLRACLRPPGKGFTFDEIVPEGKVLGVLAYEGLWDCQMQFFTKKELDSEPELSSSATIFFYKSSGEEQYQEIGPLDPDFDGKIELELFSFYRHHRHTGDSVTVF